MTDASLPEPAARVVAALEAAEVPYRLIRHGPVASLAEAAIARGVEPADVVKTLVVRVADDDFVLVLVPGDRTLHWPSLRTLLGASRLSLPDADQAKHATGFERGTITPFGSTTQWPVVADERLQGRTITLGAGVHGLAIGVPADAAVAALDAVVADVTKPS